MRRADARRRARQFFADRDVLEVDVPVLVQAAAADPHVPVLCASPHGARAPRFLHTSPEHAMKRLLCAGSGDIYYLGPVFRDGEAGRHHNPEFTMIEWYRLGFDHRRLAAETIDLLRVLLGERAPETVHSYSYRDLFAAHTGVAPDADAQALRACCRERDVDAPAALGRRALTELLFATVVCPAMPRGLSVVSDYPADQAALARIRPGAPAVAERFEVFCDGIELANGFYELADAREQRARFEAQREDYRRTGRTVPPLDERLLAALAHGLPDCSGVALGFDRALMIASGHDALAPVLPFAYDRA